MRFVNQLCSNKKCSDPSALKLLLADDGNTQMVSCQACGKIIKRGSPAVFTRSLRYPHYNASLDAVVNNRDHENVIAKQKGMVPADFLRVKAPKRLGTPKRR